MLGQQHLRELQDSTSCKFAQLFSRMPNIRLNRLSVIFASGSPKRLGHYFDGAAIVEAAYGLKHVGVQFLINFSQACSREMMAA